MFWILRFDSFYLPLDFINKTMNFAHVKKQMKTWCGWMQSHAKWPVKSITLNILWTHHVNDGQSRWLDDGGKTKGAGITRSSNHRKRSSEVQRRRFRQKLATSVVLKTGSFESDLVSCDFPSYMYNRFSGYVRLDYLNKSAICFHRSWQILPKQFVLRKQISLGIFNSKRFSHREMAGINLSLSRFACPKDSRVAAGENVTLFNSCCALFARKVNDLCFQKKRYIVRPERVI